MNIVDAVVLILIAFGLAVAGAFWGHQRNDEEGCNNSCSSCSMKCTKVNEKQAQKKEK